MFIQKITSAGKRRFFSFSAAVFFLLSATVVMVAAASSTYAVTITDGKNETSIDTRSADPSQILQQAGIQLGESDLLDSNAFRVGTASRLTVLRSFDITVIDGKAAPQKSRQHGTVSTALAAMDIPLTDADEITPAPGTPLAPDMTVTIKRAYNVTIQADGKSYGLNLLGGTVAAALEAAGISYSKYDSVKPAPDSPLQAQAVITVKRVTYQTRTEEKKVPFETKTTSDTKMAKGTRSISKKGMDGLKEVVYRDKYVDGKLAKTTVSKETVIQKPVTQIARVGSKKIKDMPLKKGLKPISELAVPTALKLDSKGLPTEYKKVFHGTSTAYCTGTRTSTGKRPQPGYIAVNPKDIPYGTELYVVSADGKYVYGYCIAADTGGFARTGSCTLDLFMNTNSECIQWGRRDVKIYILK